MHQCKVTGKSALHLFRKKEKKGKVLAFLKASHLTVAVASQLRNEAHVVITDLNHLLADIILWATACRCARPPRGWGGQSI